MRHAVPPFQGSSLKLARGMSALALVAVCGAATAAVGQPASRPAAVVDEATFHAATRQQHQLPSPGDDIAPTRCELANINDNVALIYQQDDSAAALTLARRCELLAITKSRADYRTMASRIRALVAIKAKDMSALQQAGQALIADAQSPEFVADGHLFIAFACTFSGRAACARTHLDQAKAMFARHDVAGALEQLTSVEQALLKLEASSAH